jgi:hypothetical protein
MPSPEIESLHVPGHIIRCLAAADNGLTNSVALVRERTIPTERPPLVGEVSILQVMLTNTNIDGINVTICIS